MRTKECWAIRKEWNREPAKDDDKARERLRAAGCVSPWLGLQAAHIDTWSSSWISCFFSIVASLPDNYPPKIIKDLSKAQIQMMTVVCFPWPPEELGTSSEFFPVMLLQSLPCLQLEGVLQSPPSLEIHCIPLCTLLTSPFSTLQINHSFFTGQPLNNSAKCLLQGP